MKGITNETITNDFLTIDALFQKYADAIWENQEGQKGHFDKQSKLVHVAMCDMRSGLSIARQAITILRSTVILED